MASIKSQIHDALLARLLLVPDFKYRAFDVVRLGSADFKPHELPAVQVIDLGETTVPEMNRRRKMWSLVLEIVVGPTGVQVAGEPIQKTLWDLMDLTEDTLWDRPKNFGIPGLLHMHLNLSSTDLHLLKPFYLGRLEVAFEYYQGPC